MKRNYGRGKIWTQNSALWAQPKEMEEPIPLLVLTQYIDKNLRIEAEDVDCPRSLKSEHSLGGFEQATWTKRQNTKEWGRNVQAKKKGNIQVKYPLPPHSMHCTNSAGRINRRMTPEQYPHNLQHILPPLVKPWWDKHPKKDQWLYRWRVGMQFR